MRITELKGTNIDLTSAIKSYVEQKLGLIQKLTERYSPCDVAVDVGMTSKHHQKGDIFYAEFNMSIPGAHLRAHVVRDDLYAAIDEAKDDLKRQLVDRKER
jgi:putative sigma-54 modulation protein